MATTKKLFHVTDETELIWNRLWPTRGVASESEAFRQFLFSIDKRFRDLLDPAALKLYERGELNRTEYGKACLRYRLRSATAKPTDAMDVAP